MVFIESKYILSKEISENSDFTGFNSAVILNRNKKTYIIILHYYILNTQI